MSEENKNPVSGNDYEEYVTFTTVSRSGDVLEMAVVDEFEYEHKPYVAAALITDDTIDEDSLYLYAVDEKSEEFKVNMITDQELYAKVAQAYLEME